MKKVIVWLLALLFMFVVASWVALTIGRTHKEQGWILALFFAAFFAMFFAGWFFGRPARKRNRTSV